MGGLALLVGTCAWVAGGCGGAEPLSTRAAGPAALTEGGEVAATEEAEPDLASLDVDRAASPAPVERAFVEIEVEGYGTSVVWVPPIDQEPSPLLVAAHGAGGRPEHHCLRWRQIIGDHAFLLCTRGRAMNRLDLPEEQGFFYDGHHELGRETLLALDALVRVFGDRVDARAAVYAGYSQGATMGVHFLHARTEHAARFSRVVLIEGGSEEWNVPLAQRYKTAGGERVLFVCGQQSCNERARRSERFLARAGVDVSVRYASGGGHTYLGSVGEEVERGFAWLVEGDPRWTPLPP